MNLILHQLKTDVRHFRWGISVLWITFAVELILNTLRFVPARSEIVEALIQIAQGFTAIFLIAALVQSDSLVGTTASWLTRPIRRQHLFWSKTAFILLFILMPKLVAQSIGWSASGYSWYLLLCAVGQSLLYSTALILTAAVLASLTPHLTGFFLAAGITVAGMFGWIVLIEALQRSGILPRIGTEWGKIHALPSSQTAAAFGSLLICLVLAWVAQMRLQFRRVAAMLFAAGLMSFPLAVRIWKVDFLKPRLTASVPLQIEVLQADRTPQPGSQLIFTDLAVKGVPAGQVAVPQPVHARVKIHGESRWRDLTDVQFTEQRFRPNAADSFGRIKEHFPADTVWPGNNFMTRPALPNDALAKQVIDSPKPAELMGSVLLNVYEIREVAVLPLKRATVSTLPGHRVTIRGVSLVAGTVTVNLEESSPKLLLDRDLTSANLRPYGMFQTRHLFVLYHAESQEAFLVAQTTAPHRTAVTLAETRTIIDLRLPRSPLWEKFTGKTAEDWMRGARLHVFAPVYAGSSEVAFSETNFTFAIVPQSIP